ncbi:MAG: polyprenyl synthetase family protein [Armatimonadota bacterium]|nr:polyprenyl synthetase family protein [Armatimonadota bacterium]
MTAHMAGQERVGEGRPPDWAACVRQELGDIEVALGKVIGSSVPAITRISDHLLTAGGKRLRPALVTLAAKACCAPYDPDRVVIIAAATELIHMATLMHDDVIDRTDSRRGRATANAFWGNKLTVLSGDYVLSRAFWLLTKDGDLRALRLIADLTLAMSEGEALQLIISGCVKSWEEYYWRIIRDKTARFLDVCCQCGAIVAGGDESLVKALSEYGLNLGIAFQITDDILDITGDPAKTGKPVGSDLRDGKITLPVLLALQNSVEPDGQALCKMAEQQNIGEKEITAICEAALRCGAVDMAREAAAGYVDKAHRCLEDVPSSPARDALYELAESIIGRMS